MKDITSKIELALSQWKESQKGQTSGYEYESSFVQLWRQLGQEVFQQSLGVLPKRPQEKKTSIPLRLNQCAQASCIV